jgi:hypothetical protein
VIAIDYNNNEKSLKRNRGKSFETVLIYQVFWKGWVLRVGAGNSTIASKKPE